MKKITFYVFALLFLGFSGDGIAQTLNQNAGWPNAGWTITGTFDPAGGDAFESDPTVTANFSYNDDDNATGSNQSFDDIAAESPVIDLTDAFNAGETWISITADYSYNRVDAVGEFLGFQYWDADGAVWVNYPGGVFSLADENTFTTDNLCTADRDNFTTDVLNIAGFTATQLSGFRYRIYYDDDADGGNAWEYGFCFDSPTITSDTPPTCPDPSELGVVTTQTSADLSWTENGSAMNWDIEWGTEGFTPTGTPTIDDTSDNPYNLMSLMPGTSYDFYVRADCGGDTSNWIGPFTFLTLFTTPANDECSAAEALTVNADLNCGVVTSGTTAGATASAEDDTDTSGTPNTDVWYSFVATGPAHRIELSNVTNLGGGTSTSVDMGISLYDATGGCASLVLVATSDPDAFTAIDLQAGTTYYVRVYGWQTGIQNNSFDICVGTPDPVVTGSYCSDAIVVGALPYNTSDDTSLYGDDYTGTPGTDCGSVNNHLEGDDVIYEYTATFDGSINVSLTSIGDTYAGIFAYNNCSDIGSVCATMGGANGFSTADLEFDMNVTNGETYYILISTWASPQSTTYTLDITENSCTDATVSYTVVNDCNNSGGFLIDVEITDMGSATDITVTNDQDATSFAVTSPGTVQFGPYTNGTDVVITVTDDNDGSCVQDSGAITQAACPPDNVDCSTAETVTVGIGEDGPTVVGTNLAAGDSGVPDPSCNAFYEGGDIWYVFTVPVGADNVTLDVASSGFSSIIAVVYDNCTDLNEVYCNVVFSSSATFNIGSLTGGDTYYLRLYDFSNDDIGPITFNINTPALSVDEFQEGTFKYYPNPVKNALILNAQQNIQNVRLYNMLGQEVLSTSPNTLNTEVDMSQLQAGTYFVKVSVNNATNTVRIVKQ